MEAKDLISSGILEQYVLGLTSSEENDIVESNIIKYPEVKIELDKISDSLEKYASIYSVEPSKKVKEDLFKLIEKSTNTNREEITDPVKKSAPVYKINSYLKFAAAACFFLLVGSVLLNISLYKKNKQSNSEIASVKEELNAQKQVAIDMNREISVVKNKMAMPVVLKGTPHSPESVAKIFWMKNSGEVYVDPSNLPNIPSDKQYQLWAIVDGKPVDAGMISTKNGDSYKMQKMKSFGKAEAFAITMEKSGGSKVPSMDEMVVISKI